MVLLRCTRKLLKEMGVSSRDAAVESASAGRLGEWYANLLFLDRRKCVMFVNGKTLASFLVGDLSRAEIRRMPEVFREGFSRYLAHADIPSDMASELLEEHRELAPATSHDKSVLGSMNDLAFHYKYHVPVMGSLNPKSLEEPIHMVNRMPMSLLGGMALPIEAFWSALGFKRRAEI